MENALRNTTRRLPVDAVDDRIVGRGVLFDPREALIDARHGTDGRREGEVVDAGMPLLQAVAFYPREPADQLVH